MQDGQDGKEREPLLLVVSIISIPGAMLVLLRCGSASLFLTAGWIVAIAHQRQHQQPQLTATAVVSEPQFSVLWVSVNSALIPVPCPPIHPPLLSVIVLLATMYTLPTK